MLSELMLTTASSSTFEPLWVTPASSAPGYLPARYGVLGDFAQARALSQSMSHPLTPSGHMELDPEKILALLM